MQKERIGQRLTECGIPFSAELPEKLRIYHKLLMEWNSKMDLTAITDEDEMLDRHYIDSLMILTTSMAPAEGVSVIDVGTGAGFPGFPIALARPDLKVTLLDSQQKRLSFLRAVLDELGVGNVTLIHDRAEDGARRPELRESFDLALARAVAPLNVLSEYLLPYVKTGGRAVCWKGPGVADELNAGRKAAFLLGGKLSAPVRYIIPDRDWQHGLIYMEKVSQTPRVYPRKAGTPKSRPLGL